METPPTGPGDFQSLERASWDSVAAAWSEWWQHFEAAAQPLNERLVELAGVRDGSAVLDVATGLGEPALTAARRAGPRGRVTATDFSAGMLGFARERAAERDLGNVDFLERDAEHLDLPPASFDAAVCRWGLMLMADPRAALASVRAALRPGARFAAAVWAAPEQVPFLALPRAVVCEELDLPPIPAPGLDAEPGPFRLAAAPLVEELFTGAGFQDVRVEPFEVVFEFAAPAEFARFIAELSSSMRKTLAERSAAERKRFFAALEAAAAEHGDPAGRLSLRNRTWCAVGRTG